MIYEVKIYAERWDFAKSKFRDMTLKLLIGAETVKEAEMMAVKWLEDDMMDCPCSDGTTSTRCRNADYKIKAIKEVEVEDVIGPMAEARREVLCDVWLVKLIGIDNKAYQILVDQENLTRAIETAEKRTRNDAIEAKQYKVEDIVEVYTTK